MRFPSCISFIFLIFFSAYSYSGDKIKNNEVVCACGTFGGTDKCIEHFGGEICKRQLGSPRRKWEDKNGHWEVMYCIGLAQDRDRWRDVVNTLMNPLGSIKCREFLY